MSRDDECIVCRECFGEGERLVEFPCEGRHVYHEVCIVRWVNREAWCPTCRTPLYKGEGGK